MKRIGFLYAATLAICLGASAQGGVGDVFEQLGKAETDPLAVAQVDAKKINSACLGAYDNHRQFCSCIAAKSIRDFDQEERSVLLTTLDAIGKKKRNRISAAQADLMVGKQMLALGWSEGQALMFRQDNRMLMTIAVNHVKYGESCA